MTPNPSPVSATSAALVRLLGAGPARVSLDGGVLRFGDAEGTPVGGIDSIETPRSWFWTRLTVREAGGAERAIGGLGRKEADRLAEAVRADAARVVGRIFDMADLGTGMLHIARALSDEGIASPAGKLWTKNGVHFIPRNEVYTGTLVWGANARTRANPVRIEKAFPAIVSKAKFNRVDALMRSRAPKIAHPRRVASTHLLSGLVKCRACRRAFSGQEAKSGQFAYYVCQSS